MTNASLARDNRGSLFNALRPSSIVAERKGHAATTASSFHRGARCSVLGSSPASGAKPIRSCPAEPSAYVLMDRDTWWDRTVLGFENEGISVYDDNGDFTEEFDQVAVELGFVDGADLEFFVRVAGWDSFDLTHDGFVCMKDRPDTPGNPDYLLGGVNNTSSAR